MSMQSNACFAAYSYAFSELAVFPGGVVQVVMDFFPTPIASVTLSNIKTEGVVTPALVGKQLTVNAGQANYTMFW